MVIEKLRGRSWESTPTNILAFQKIGTVLIQYGAKMFLGGSIILRERVAIMSLASQGQEYLL